MIASPSICLASASPRRRLMLEQAGFEIDIRPSDLDDALLVRQKVSPRQWVMALAWFKARRVAELLSQTNVQEKPDALILTHASASACKSFVTKEGEGKGQTQSLGRGIPSGANNNGPQADGAAYESK